MFHCPACGGPCAVEMLREQLRDQAAAAPPLDPRRLEVAQRRGIEDGAARLEHLPHVQCWDLHGGGLGVPFPQREALRAAYTEAYYRARCATGRRGQADAIAIALTGADAGPDYGTGDGENQW